MIRQLTRFLLALQFALLCLLCWALRHLFPQLSLVAGALAALFILVLGRMAIIGAGFLLAIRDGSPTPAAFRLNAAQSLRLFLREYRASMRCWNWGMPFARVGQSIAAHPRGLPVLLVHGYGGNSGYWMGLAKRLRESGRSYRALDLEPAFGAIDDYTPLIGTGIDALCAATGSDRVIILAHSMGGLAARAYLRARNDPRVVRLITLGSPHHGTMTARLGLGENTRQMRRAGPGVTDPGINPWLSELNRSETPQRRNMIVSLYSHHDNIVCPQTSSHLEGAHNIALYGVGHVDLCFHPAVVVKIMEQLALAEHADGASPQERI